MCRARGSTSERARPLGQASALAALPVQQQHLRLVLLQVSSASSSITPSPSLESTRPAYFATVQNHCQRCLPKGVVVVDEQQLHWVVQPRDFIRAILWDLFYFVYLIAWHDPFNVISRALQFWSLLVLPDSVKSNSEE